MKKTSPTLVLAFLVASCSARTQRQEPVVEAEGRDAVGERRQPDPLPEAEGQDYEAIEEGEDAIAEFDFGDFAERHNAFCDLNAHLDIACPRSRSSDEIAESEALDRDLEEARQQNTALQERLLQIEAYEKATAPRSRRRAKAGDTER
jgi:hypothetical protein